MIIDSGITDGNPVRPFLWVHQRLTTSQSVAMVLTCTFLIDLNGQTAALQAKPLAHYVVVRADLPHGSQVAQVVHCSGESASPRPTPGTIAIALHARDEAHLAQIAQSLFDAGIEHHCVFEADDDPTYPGQMMSIGLYPTRDRDKVRKVLSSLPLVR